MDSVRIIIRSTDPSGEEGYADALFADFVEVYVEAPLDVVQDVGLSSIS
jgi:hypothetical protein